MFELFVNSDLVRAGVERQFTAENAAEPRPRFRRLRAVAAAGPRLAVAAARSRRDTPRVRRTA